MFCEIADQVEAIRLVIPGRDGEQHHHVGRPSCSTTTATAVSDGKWPSNTFLWSAADVLKGIPKSLWLGGTAKFVLVNLRSVVTRISFVGQPGGAANRLVWILVSENERMSHTKNHIKSLGAMLRAPPLVHLSTPFPRT